ncbi:MAG: N-glycosylase/DNA lyase [Candidatus Micrarchaeia archaeon]
MLTKNTLKSKYAKHRKAIESRLVEFESVGRLEDGAVFAELCFCILTPQSKASAASKAIGGIFKAGNGGVHGADTLQIIKSSGVRFHNTKAQRLRMAHSLFFGKGRKMAISELLALAKKDEPAARDWLVENVMGIGMKEAGHFLRNVGHNRELAILDRHIIANLHSLGAIKSRPKTLSRAKYLKIEREMKRFSKSAGIPMSHLDLLFWSEQTGYIFK